VIFAFTGTSASININGAWGTSSVDLFIDNGAPVVITNVNGSSITTPKLTHGHHVVELRKRSEASFGTFRVTDVTTDGMFGAVPPTPRRKIEIVGDSISVGYGLDGTLPCTDSAALQDNPKTYGAVAAAALEADYSVVAWSGKGAIRNYASTPPADQDLVPELYTRYGANDPDDSFTFPPAWVPDAVVINLGTNDFSYLHVRDPLNTTAYTSAMVAFVRSIHAHYPRTEFFLMSSPMLNDNYPTTADAQHSTMSKCLQTAISQLGTGIKAHFVDWPAQGSDVGCDYHPIASTHAQGAALLEAAIKSVLGW